MYIDFVTSQVIHISFYNFWSEYDRDWDRRQSVRLVKRI